jgi:hypothetical protein
MMQFSSHSPLTPLMLDDQMKTTLLFCKQVSGNKNCLGFWMMNSYIPKNVKMSFCPDCQNFEQNEAKRQEQHEADKGRHGELDSKVNHRYLSPDSKTGHLRSAQNERLLLKQLAAGRAAKNCEIRKCMRQHLVMTSSHFSRRYLVKSRKDLNLRNCDQTYFKAYWMSQRKTQQLRQTTMELTNLLMSHWLQ